MEEKTKMEMQINNLEIRISALEKQAGGKSLTHSDVFSPGEFSKLVAKIESLERENRQLKGIPTEQDLQQDKVIEQFKNIVREINNGG